MQSRSGLASIRNEPENLSPRIGAEDARKYAATA